jgi:flagellar export protein FliJ
MNGLKYPLEQLMTIKKNRYDQAVKILEEKKALLEKEKQTLIPLVNKRDEVRTHKQDKLEQLREVMDQGTTSDKIEQMKNYLKVVGEKLQDAQNKVDKQQEKVDEANRQVETARQDLYAKQKDVEKLEMHRKDWEKEVKLFEERQEAIEHDELGAASHTVRKIEKKKKKDV